jgi:hypothetical protein
MHVFTKFSHNLGGQMANPAEVVLVTRRNLSAYAEIRTVLTIFGRTYPLGSILFHGTVFPYAAFL